MIKVQSRSSDNPKTTQEDKRSPEPKQSLEETTKDLLQSLTLKIDPVIVNSEKIQTVNDDNTTIRWKVNSEVPLDFYFNPLSFIFLTMTSSRDPFNQARKLKVIEKCLELAG